MLQLEDVLSQAGLDLTGWELTEVAALSSDGTTLVGKGINPLGDIEAWRAVLPDLSTLSLPQQPPVVAQPNSMVGFAGGEASFLLTSSDPNGDPLSFVANGLPPGLAIDPNTGLISGTHTPGSEQNDAYEVAVQVSDGVQTVYIAFPWEVLAGTGVPTMGPLGTLCLFGALAALGWRSSRRRDFLSDRLPTFL